MDVGKIIKDVDEGRWHKIPDTAVEILIKRLKPKEVRRLRKESIQWEHDGRRQVKELNETKLEENLLDAVVLDWKNITMEGQPLECNRANKLILNDNWTEFSVLWNDVVGNAGRQDEERQGEEVKN